jgi:hypothetical protein
MTTLYILALLAWSILVFVFGVLFARHNAKKAQAIQDAANASAARAKKAAEEIIAKARQDARDDADRASKE